MCDFKVLVPEGFEVVETDRIVTAVTEVIYTHFFKQNAKRQAEELNEARRGPLLRYVVEPASGRGFWWDRWAVVPYQNVLRKIDDE